MDFFSEDWMEFYYKKPQQTTMSKLFKLCCSDLTVSDHQIQLLQNASICKKSKDFLLAVSLPDGGWNSLVDSNVEAYI